MVNSIESGRSFGQQESKEQEPRYKLIARIALSGLGGTGKTVFIKSLGRLCELDISENSFHVIKIGEKVRQWKKDPAGERLLGFIPRTQDEDRRIDEFQQYLLSYPDPTYNCIIESRLAGVWASEIKEKAKEEGTEIPPIVSILLTANEPTRLSRVWERDRKVKKDLTREESNNNARAKIVGDQNNFSLAHPAIMTKINKNPLDPTASGLYDIHIDTNNLPQDEVLQIAIQELMKKGALIELIRKKTSPASGTVFDANPQHPPAA